MTTITISLPDQIAGQVDAETKSKGFSTRSEFIRSLLRKYFWGEEPKFEVYSPKPLNDVEIQLTQTGKYSPQFITSVIEGLKNSSPYAAKTTKP